MGERDAASRCVQVERHLCTHCQNAAAMFCETCLNRQSGTILTGDRKDRPKKCASRLGAGELFAEEELQEWWQRQSNEHRAALIDAARHATLDPATVALLFESRCPVGPIGTQGDGQSDYTWIWPEDVLRFITGQ